MRHRALVPPGVHALPGRGARRVLALALHLLRLFPELRGFFDRERLARLKPGAILINTARGELIGEAAMIEVLTSGRLRGAGLDVFSQSQLPADHPLLRLDNVVLTPSSAWNTVDSSPRSLRTSIDNVLAFIAGKPASITNAAAIGRR